jgi:hypothetical protein
VAWLGSASSPESTARGLGKHIARITEAAERVVLRIGSVVDHRKDLRPSVELIPRGQISDSLAAHRIELIRLVGAKELVARQHQVDTDHHLSVM